MRPASLKGIGLAAALLSLTAQAAPAVTAQDVFDQVVYELAISYGGGSKVKPSDLRRKYLPELQKVCAGKSSCQPENTYPIIGKLIGDLGDKHTNFFTPSQLEEIGKRFAGQASSRKTFGMVTEALGSGGRVVQEVLPDSPAKDSGVQVGDVLRSVNGVSLDGNAGGQALQRASLRDVTTFEVLRGGKTIKATVSAKSIVVPPLTMTVADKVALLRLRHFSTPGIAQQVNDAIASAKKQGVDGLILDLRYNSGGRVEEYLLSAGAFMQPEPLYLKGRLETVKISNDSGKYAVNSAVQNPLTLKNATRYDGPLVVMVDRDTASSAEFLARNLQQRPCTVVAGEATAGVADTVTRFEILPDGSGLQLTFAQVEDAGQQKLGEHIVPQTRLNLQPSALAKAGQDVALAEAQKILRELRQSCQGR